MKGRILTAVAMVGALGLFFGAGLTKSHEKSVMAYQTPANSCGTGQVVTSQLVNTGQSCSSVAAMPGMISYFGMTGTALPSYSCVLVTGSSTVSGTFSMTFTASPLWTTPASVFAMEPSIVSPGTSVGQSYTAYVTGVTSTSVTGTVKSGTTLSILGATLVAGSVAAPITDLVCGY